MEEQTQAKTKIPCGVEGCDYVAVHKDPIVAKRTIGVHRSKHHGIMSPTALKLLKAKQLRDARLTRHKLSDLSQEAESLNRELKSTGKSEREKILDAILQDFNYCPKCGNDLSKHIAALIAIASQS